VLSAFYDLFVGISSFTAGWVAHQFNYSATFAMAAVALVAAAVAGKFVFVEGVQDAQSETAVMEAVASRSLIRAASVSERPAESSRSEH
jgi:hypothetical protein